MRKIRVAWVIAPLAVKGGTWKHLWHWAHWLPRDRFDVTLYYGTPNPTEVRPALESLGVPLVEVPELSRPKRSPLAAVRALRRLWIRELPDIVHTFFIQTDILATLAARAAGVPAVLSSVEGRLIPRHVGWIGRRIYRAGYRLAAPGIRTVLTLTNATAREVLEDVPLPEEKLRVLYSGVEPSTIRKSPAVAATRAAPVVGGMGELIAPKGFHDLISAAPAILKRIPATRFDIAGKGPARSDLESQVRGLGIQDQVRFVGFQEPLGFLDDLDVFVFPSHPNYDGLPWVLLEALSRGTAIVATRVAGVPEAIRDGVDGLLVAPGDPSAIAEAVTRVLTDPALAERLRAGALARAGAFTVEREIAELASIYEGAIEKP